MRVFITRLQRLQKYRHDFTLPNSCYAKYHPDVYTNMSLVCDCQIFCKFRPPGNTPIIACSDTSAYEHTLKVSQYRNKISNESI